MQTKFKVCVGVRSGPKGPVNDLSIVGLESLSKQNLGFALGYGSTWKYELGGPNACPIKI